jgi:hypothetical protein
MSIHDNLSCGQPFSPMGLVIIGVLVLASIVLWQLGPSVGTLVLLPLMLICPWRICLCIVIGVNAVEQVDKEAWLAGIVAHLLCARANKQHQ